MRPSLLLPLPVVLLALAACNAPPAAPEIVINPGEPRTDADLTVVFLALTTDENKDEVTHTFRWFENGTLRDDLTSDTVPAAETDKGETWKVVVTPNDGELDGAPAEAEVTILDTEPTASVTLGPDGATTEDDLVATATAEDIDGDAVTFTYAWTRDGQASDWTEATVPATQTSHGETWEVTVTPNDGELAGAPVTASITVGNTLPTVERVELAPAPAYEDSLLVATAFGVDDLDDDAVTLTYTWLVNDTEVQSSEDDTLTGALFSKHDLVRVEVTPADSYGNGTVVASEDLLIENSAPSGTSVSVVSSASDGAAYETSTMTCTPTGWSDADGDAEGWTYAWQVDGATVSTGMSISGAMFNRGSVVTCVATPNDGEADGAALTASAVRVANSLPVLASATLSTSAPTESDTLSVTLGTAFDADGDTISYAYDWTVNGSLVATSSTLTASRWRKGDTIAVTVTPYDGTDTGAPVTSGSAIAVNTPPEVRSVSLTPTSLYTNDMLTASVTTTDADGDSVSLSYQWYVNGVPRGSDASSLSGATWFDKGDSVYVVVTPDDGDDAGSASTSSSVTVRNSAPTAPVVSIDPVDPVAGDTLVCNVDSDATDADGDAITYSFSWTQDGAAFGSAGRTYEAGDTVAGTYVQDEETWVCSVTAGDGEATGPEASVSVRPSTDCGILTLDGSNDYAIAASPSGLATSSITVSAWVKFTSSARGTVWVKKSSSLSGWYMYGLNTSPTYYYAKAQNAYFVSDGASFTLVEGAWSAAASVWHHLAQTYSASTGLHAVYLDGTLVASRTVGAGLYNTGNSEEFSIGSETGTSGGRGSYFSGNVDDITIYNRALTSTEVRTIATGGATPTSGVIAQWGFDTPSSSTVADLSGNGHTLTLYNGAAATTSTDCY